MNPLAVMLIVLVAAVGQVPPPFDRPLTDLDGESVAVSTNLGRPTVVMVVTARRLRGLRAWERALRERYDDLRYVRIADVAEEPPPSHERVADKLRPRVPPDVQVLVDVERHWARGLALDTDRPNLLVLDRDGALAGVVRGRYDERLLQEVCAMIDEMRSQP